MTPPPVPEGLESRDEARPRRVKPGKLVQEDELASSVVALLKKQLQHEERVQPVLGTRASFHSLDHERVIEALQLHLERAYPDSPMGLDGRQASMAEGYPAPERLVNEEGLADTSPAVDSNELCTVALVQTVEQGGLGSSSNHALPPTIVINSRYLLKFSFPANYSMPSSHHGRDSASDPTPAGGAKPRRPWWNWSTRRRGRACGSTLTTAGWGWAATG